MKKSIIFVFLMVLACQAQNKDTGKAENISETASEITQLSQSLQASETNSSKSNSETQEENIQCTADVCLQLRNIDKSNKSFEIYMINSVPVAGFQCDLPGIEIISADGGLLKENGYQTSNSTSRILSFSMQAKLIPVGMGILTKIYYDNPTKSVCMTEIIFAGIGGAKLSNNEPECLTLN